MAELKPPKCGQCGSERLAVIEPPKDGKDMTCKDCGHDFRLGDVADAMTSKLADDLFDGLTGGLGQ